MDDGQALIVEMNETIWGRFLDAVAELTPEEADWRPLPQANNIALILRHLRLEAAWHLASLERGAIMPGELAPEVRHQIDSVPVDFEEDSKELARLFLRYLVLLRQTPIPKLQQLTREAYGSDAAGPTIPAHFLGFHQATHLASHVGQIRALRNLYRKTRGEPPRFHADNPTYPV